MQQVVRVQVPLGAFSHSKAQAKVVRLSGKQVHQQLLTHTAFGLEGGVREMECVCVCGGGDSWPTCE